MNIAHTTRQGLVHSGWFNLLLGMWLVVSPFVLGFGRNIPALWSNIAVGIAVMLLALGSGTRTALVQWLSVPLGLWLFLSSFVFGFARWALPLNNVIVTFLIIAGGAASNSYHEARVARMTNDE